mmetsp:Transcript_45212/g.145486  ORF Transcript_45212/g.145486 Transcript_45212/m.145486 type:complete len:307 (-) Transcript_45212:734-1654(-)
MPDVDLRVLGAREDKPVVLAAEGGADHEAALPVAGVRAQPPPPVHVPSMHLLRPHVEEHRARVPREREGRDRVSLIPRVDVLCHHPRRAVATRRERAAPHSAAAHGQQPRAVGRDGKVRDARAVPRLQRVAAQVPQDDPLASAARGEEVRPRRQPHDRGHRLGVLAEGRGAIARRRVPQLDCAVGGAREQQRVVGTPRDSSDGAGVCRDERAPSELRLRRLPQHDSAVAGGGGEGGARVRERDAPHLVSVALEHQRRLPRQTIVAKGDVLKERRGDVVGREWGRVQCLPADCLLQQRLEPVLGEQE